MGKQDDYIRTALRVPPELHAEIHRRARESGRTFNAEILAALAIVFEGDKTLSPAQAEELTKRVRELTELLKRDEETT